MRVLEEVEVHGRIANPVPKCQSCMLLSAPFELHYKEKEDVKAGYPSATVSAHHAYPERPF